MGQTNLTDKILTTTLPPGQELELKKVHSKGDTMVTINGRFIGYIKWEKAEEFAKDMLEAILSIFQTLSNKKAPRPLAGLGWNFPNLN